MARSNAGPALIYRIFFLYIEPFFAFLGAYTAFFHQRQYLQLSHAPTAPQNDVPISTSIVLNQLANLYLLFAVNEALVLRATADIKVWRPVIVGLLIADLGHIYSVHPLGSSIYWDVSNWNGIDWGNLGFVYIGASIRISFLLSPSGLPSWLRIWRRSKPTTTRRSTRRSKPTPKLKV